MGRKGWKAMMRFLPWMDLQCQYTNMVYIQQILKTLESSQQSPRNSSRSAQFQNFLLSPASSTETTLWLISRPSVLGVGVAGPPRRAEGGGAGRGHSVSVIASIVTGYHRYYCPPDIYCVGLAVQPSRLPSFVLQRREKPDKNWSSHLFGQHCTRGQWREPAVTLDTQPFLPPSTCHLCSTRKC